MKETKLEEALRALFEQEREQAPERHPLETDACLPLSRLVMFGPGSWTAEEESHVRSCQSYCQRMIGIRWRERCPNIRELIAYLRDRENHRLRAAFEFHIEKDQCRWCGAVAASALAVESPGRIAAALIPLRVASGWGFAHEAEVSSDLLFRKEEDSEGGLKWLLYETPDHQLKLDVESSDTQGQTGQKRHVLVTLRGETAKGETVSEDIPFPDLEWNGHVWRNHYTLGMAGDIAKVFGDLWHVIVRLPDEQP